MNPEKLYPSRTVRDRFGISDMTLWRWVRKGVLPSPVQINGRNYFPASNVDALAAGKQPQHVAA
jgi:predicted site-specific integrase-resolvase